LFSGFLAGLSCSSTSFCIIAHLKTQIPVILCRKREGKLMKKDIHPEYMECKVSCACGNNFETMSNTPEMRIDICNECHPFFTGSQKIVDAAGRVEKFKKKYNLK
jgi:large subunit ribosomal protein L31